MRRRGQVSVSLQKSLFMTKNEIGLHYTLLGNKPMLCSILANAVNQYIHINT